MDAKEEEQLAVGGVQPSISPPSALRSLFAKYPGKIPVHLVDKHAYVWRVEDVARLRSEWHICGLLSGTLPAIPQQNVFLGLPLQLFEEEIVFLIRSKAIILISDSVSFDAATKSEYQQYQQAFEADVSEQERKHAESSQKGKGAKIEKLLNQAAKSAAASAAGSDAAGSVAGSASDSIIPPGKAEGKSQENLLQKALERRLQREEKRRLARLQQSSGEDQNESLQSAADESALSLFSPDPSATPPEPSPSMQLSGPTSPDRGKGKAAPGLSDASYMHVTAGSALEPHFPMEWYHPDNEHARSIAEAEGKDPAPARVRVHETLSSAKRAGDWVYPEAKKERAKCAVFEDLQKRGYYMGKGLRFGGDFVVYPGDPLRYHSHFTASVRESPKAPISLMELIANGRLGTAVKKAHCISSASGVREDADVSLEVLEEEDGIEQLFGTVEHFSLTWGGFGT